VLNPLVEHRLRPRAVGALPAVELVDELGKDASAFCGIGDDDGCRRQICGDAVLEVKVNRGCATRLASQLRDVGAGMPLR